MYNNIIKTANYITQNWNAFNVKYPQWGFKHKGIDFGTHGVKASCYALMEGYITYAAPNAGWGNYVELYNSNLNRVFIYAHLDKIEVKKDQYVEKNDPIGIIGSTGISTGIHLHFGVALYKNQKYMWEDPIPYLEEHILPLTTTEMIIQNLTKAQKQKIEDLENGKTVLTFEVETGNCYVIRDSKKLQLPAIEAVINTLFVGAKKEDLDKIANKS